jgi:A/G-specific adenine glycosylase
MSFAYNAPYAAMDGNVYRVLSRLLDIDEAFDSSVGKKLFRSEMNLLLDSEHPRLFNSAIMELGALWCTPILDDHCEHCPLRDFCLGYQRGTAAMLPIRKPRPVLRDRWLHYTIYLCRIDNELHTLIHQRTAQDIWKHLYEFILNEYDNEEQWLDADTSQSSITTTHILSHQRLHARFTIQPVDTLPTIPNSMCIRWSELDQYALSRLTLKVLEQMGSII